METIMFVRALIKSEAREKIKKDYLKTVAAVGLYLAIGVVIAVLLPSFRFPVKSAEETVQYIQQHIKSISGALAVSAVSQLIVTIFITDPLETGLYRFFIENDKGVCDIKNMFTFFRSDYFNVVKVKFLYLLRIFLWSLLLVIPGIIKLFEYYILAETPDMESGKVFAQSRRMTRGIKFKLFLFELSFLPWYILCAFTGYIGMVFLLPYLVAARVRLYMRIKEAASENEY